MVCLGVLQHLEGGADQLMSIVQCRAFHKLQAILVHNDPYPSLLKHPEKKMGCSRKSLEWNLKKGEFEGIEDRAIACNTV